MKTIPELSETFGIHRDTLRKAALRDEFPSRKAGERAYLIDDESPEFKEWLQSRERKTNDMTNWIERAHHYEYPVGYPSHLRAAKAAQRLEQKLSIFTETAEIRDEDSGESYFVVITKNDVPHSGRK